MLYRTSYCEFSSTSFHIDPSSRGICCSIHDFLCSYTPQQELPKGIRRDNSVDIQCLDSTIHLRACAREYTWCKTAKLENNKRCLVCLVRFFTLLTLFHCSFLASSITTIPSAILTLTAIDDHNLKAWKPSSRPM